MYTSPTTLADTSKIWIYQSDRELTTEEQTILNLELKNFISEWTSHNVALTGSFQVLHNRFMIIMIDESTISAGGCSLDKCIHFIKTMESRFNVNFLNRMLLAYKENNEIKTLSKSRFEDLLKSGQLNENTIVFNNLIEKKSDLLSNWEVPVKESWHKAMLNNN